MRKLILILVSIISFSQAQTIQYIGAPTTTVISRGNFRTDSIFYLPKRTKLPTDTAAFRYQISDSSLYVWSGYQWLRAGGSGSINGTLTTNYIPKATGTATIGNSLLYTSGNNLMFNSTTPYTTNSGWSTSEVNASSVALNVWKINDTARGYIAHNGTLMEINNLRNGDLTFVTNSSTRGRFTSTGDFRVNTLGGTGSRVVVASSNGTLSASSSATDLIDTTYISSRAWRQKGDDSLGAIIATKGSGTVTSVATGYGLSGGTISTTGTLIADTALVASRLRLGKVADSLSLVKQNVLTNPVTGTGTTNYVPKFTGTSTIGNSLIFDNGSNIGINTTSPVHLLNLSQTSGGTVIQLSNTFNTPANRNWSLQSNYLAYGDFSINTSNALFGDAYNAGTARMYINPSGEILINTTTDAGAYTLQNNGALYNTGNAILAATSGSVGIGVTSPSYKLDVRTSAVNDVALLLTSAGGGSYLLFADGNTVTAPKIGGFGDQIFFQTSNITRARINTSGNFLLGTTNNLTRLTVQESSTTDVAHFSTVTSGSYLIFADGNTTSAPKLGAVTNSLAFITSGTEKARFHANGGLKYVPQSAAPTAEAGTVYYDSDDNKLKVYNGTTWVDLH